MSLLMENENKSYLGLEKKLRVKYIADKVLAYILLFILLPFVVVIVWMMKMDSLFHPADSGSIFYTEPRISSGQSFNILKFRTVTQEGIKWIREQPESRTISSCDFRTLAGKFIVKWYLDELPQLLNIIKGEMSLVGPRPHIIQGYKEEIAQGLIYRKFIKAGLFGIPQACKRHPKQKKMFERIAKIHKSKIKVLNTIDGLYGRICIEYSIFPIMFFDFIIIARCLYDYYARGIPFIPSEEKK